MRTLRPVLMAFVTALCAPTIFAVQPGTAAGTVTLDGAPVALAHATSGTRSDLYDDSKQNTVIVLSDKALGDTSPDDDYAIKQRAEAGELTALTLRLDGRKLVNAYLNAQAIDGTIVLPGAWFAWKPANGEAGSITLARHDASDHTVACAVEFSAVPGKKVEPPAEEAPAPVETIASPPPAPENVPPATTSNIDPQALAGLFVAAVMQKDEEQGLKLIQLGLNPNARDQYGIGMLNWAVMNCMPRLVEALIKKGADLSYQRTPGLTILQEAGACPEAEKLLRAAGAK